MPESPPDPGNRMPGKDNPPTDPSRLFDVADRGGWEDELRRCLADRAAEAPHTRTDLAGTAIRRARRTHRRRAVAGLAAVVVATVLATGGWLHSWHNPGPSEYGAITGLVGEQTPSPAPEPTVGLVTDEQLAAELSVDLLGDGVAGGVVLATAAGEMVDLAGVQRVASAQRVGDGWVAIGGQDGLLRLWWLAEGREPVSLLAGMDAVVADGQRVAWRRGPLLSAAALSPDGELTGRVSTTAPDGGQPVGFLGPAVLLRRTDENGVASWDVWSPAEGDYRRGWSEEVVRVFGSLPDGSAVGLVPERSGAQEGDGGDAGERLCLARLDVARSLAVTATECLTGALADELVVEGPAAVSPQGRWLVSGGATAPLLVDLVRLFQPAGSAQAGGAVVSLHGVAQPTSTPRWLGSERVLLPSEDHLVQLRPDQLVDAGPDAAVERFPLAGAPPVVVESS